VRHSTRSIKHAAMLVLGSALLFTAGYLADGSARASDTAGAGALPLPPRGGDLVTLERHGRSMPGSALPDHSEAIRATALDYIEGWYAGDAERMARSLHPSLAKRIVDGGPNARDGVADMTAEQLVNGTRRGGGRSTPAAERGIAIRILDQYENAASVRVDARDWIDYMHLGRVDGRWVIINVLWERRPA
jgi:hypothetical protein